MIRFTCKCGKHMKVEDKYAGRKGKCPQCKEIVVIPQSDNTGLDDLINDVVDKPQPQLNQLADQDNQKKIIYKRLPFLWRENS